MAKKIDWVNLWNDPVKNKSKKDHIIGKQENYNIIKEFLETPPMRNKIVLA